MKESCKRQYTFDFRSVSFKKTWWKLLEGDELLPQPTGCNTLSYPDQNGASPSQTFLPNTVWGISDSHSVEIAYYQVLSISRFTPFLLRQDSLWSLTLLRLKNFIWHTKKVMIRFDLMWIKYGIQRKRKSDNQRIIPCGDVSWWSKCVQLKPVEDLLWIELTVNNLLSTITCWSYWWKVMLLPRIN